MYSSKEVVKLYQILSMKSLGFSLDEVKKILLTLNTPAQVAEALENQSKLLCKKVAELQEVLSLINDLHDEVLQIDRVDFEKYDNIVGMLKAGNEFYWTLKLFDNTLVDHTEQRFSNKPEFGQQILDTYQSILDEAVALVKMGEPPKSEHSMAFAKRWWDMVMDFTGGDMKLLPKLMGFNGDKSGWNEEIAEK